MMWKWLLSWFRPTLTPLAIGDWVDPTEWEVGKIIKTYRPDLYPTYRQKMTGGPVEFGQFLDEHFPIETRWGLLGIGEIAPTLKAYFGAVTTPAQVDNIVREMMAAVKARTK